MATIPDRVRCPTCQRKGNWLALPSGPFCSARCRLIDLGQWLAEGHRISDPLKPGQLDHVEDFGPPAGTGGHEAD